MQRVPSNRIKGDMYMKKETRIISLSIVAILALCLLNVAAASPTNPATAPHSKIVPGVKAQQPTTLTFTCDAQATVNKWYNFGGSLTAGGTGVSGALINVQQLYHGNWVTLGNQTTDSNGNFGGQLKSQTTGDRTHRVTFDGDSQYASSVSNVIVTTIS
jgi:hypothetical protein